MQEMADRPNILRAIVGEIHETTERRSAEIGGLEADELVCLETNIDDMNPQLYSPAISRLFDAGARDVATGYHMLSA